MTQRHDQNKLYALHAPEVACIAKGKAHRRYEFGAKVSLAITNREGLVVGMHSHAGNPYAGQTLVHPAHLRWHDSINVDPLRGEFQALYANAVIDGHTMALPNNDR